MKDLKKEIEKKVKCRHIFQDLDGRLKCSKCGVLLKTKQKE